MADSTRKTFSWVTVPRSDLSDSHTGDGTEQTFTIDCTGLDSVLVTMLPGASLTAGSYSIEEGPYDGAPAAHFDEVASGSLTASTLAVERITVYGSYVKIKVTADDSVDVEACAN